MKHEFKMQTTVGNIGIIDIMIMPMTRVNY